MGGFAGEQAGDAVLIYIIDGDLEWGKTVERALKGYETRVFTDGLDAIEAMGERRPDGVVCAVELVGPNAFSLLNEMRSDAGMASIPMLLLTDVPIGEVSAYGVTAALSKYEMKPEMIAREVEKWT